MRPPPEAPERDPRIGLSVGNLTLVERLGEGAMGIVYRAEHRVLRSSYAIKVLHERYGRDEESLARFRREAIAASRLRHENVVFLTDFGVEPGVGLYIAMEAVDGEDLGVLLQAGPLSVPRVGRIALQIADALGAAHRLGIVHRDLKPDNVVILSDPLRRDFVKILDFGIALMRGDEEQESDGALGTPNYMAPEQVLDKKLVGPGTDIYALGCVIFALLTGRPPFDGGTQFEILTRHVTEPPAPIGQHREELAGTALEALVSDLLQKSVKQRPSTMNEVRQRLDEALTALREAGIGEGWFSYEASHDSLPALSDISQTASGSQHTVKMTAVIRQIRESDPSSPAGLLLAALPNVGALQGEVLVLALWGILQQEVMDAQLGTDAFRIAVDQLVLLMEAVLESHDGSSPSQTQRRVFRSLGNLLGLLERSRRMSISRALRPLTTHPLFPPELLPDSISGTWQLLDALRGGDGREAASGEELEQMSLGEKLRQPISLRSISAVLAHDVMRTTGSHPAVGTHLVAPEDVAASHPEMAPARVTVSAGGAETEASEEISDTELDKLSFVDKLRQDVSVRSLRSLLTHDLFGRKKEE